jgi:hypothetical protein
MSKGTDPVNGVKILIHVYCGTNDCYRQICRMALLLSTDPLGSVIVTVMERLLREGPRG